MSYVDTVGQEDILKSSGTPSFWISSSFPRATLSMLLDFLHDITVLQQPDNPMWYLRGFFILPSDAKPTYSVPNSQILFITRSREGKDLIDQYPGSPFFIVHDGDAAPDWAKNYSDRVMVVKKDRAYSYILFHIQEFFLNMMFWARRMEELANHKGTLQDLIDASSDILENFVAITDNTNSLLAYSKDSKAPDKISRMLVDNGFYTEKMLTALQISNSADRNTIKLLKTKDNDGNPLETYIFPIRHDGVNLGMCLMTCNKIQMSDGLRDYMRLFIDWIGRLYDRKWRVELEMKSPMNTFLINLIDGNPMSEEYLDSQKKTLGLPEKPQFKLVLFKADVGALTAEMQPLTNAVKMLNSGGSIPFRYSGDLLNLMFADDSDDGTFSIMTVNEDVSNNVCNKFGIYAGTSQVFQNIEDLDMAYRQALLACQYKSAIDAENSIIQSNSQKTVYAFEDALIYYLIDSKSDTDKFKGFTFSHSFLDKVIERDRKNGSNDFALIWVYLSCDCNISMTAK